MDSGCCRHVNQPNTPLNSGFGDRPGGFRLRAIQKMKRRAFLSLLGLTACNDYLEEMDKKKILTWWMGSGVASSAFDDVWGWWRADTYTGTNPNITLTDLSPNGRNMVQAAGTLTPGTAANGQARIAGNATARLTNASTLKRWPVTIITVGRRAAGATCGFFGHQGASPFNSLWTGYESTNRHFIYNTNGTTNTTTDAGADACWMIDWSCS